MQKADTNISLYDSDDELDLMQLFNMLWQGKLIIISVTTLVSILAVLYSLSLPNIYESKALLVPVNQSSSISSALKNYQGLAGFAGINLSSSGGETNSSKAKKTISSLSFFEQNILKNISLPDLMAVRSWSSETNTLTYDDNIYQAMSNSWKKTPTSQQAYKAFVGKHLSLKEEKTSSFITISIKHQSPTLAKQWTELVVNQVNNFYRQKDKEESEKAINFLNQQILTTSFSEVKQVLAELLQEETKKLTLIEANQFYVFDYIDPPAIMENKSQPKRALICIISAFFGGLLSILFVFIKHFFFNRKVE